MDWLDNNTVESHRLTHESDLEWSLRRAFILKHGDKFPVPRLICLASCFINIECYGCRYPDKVMLQVRELTEGLQEVIDYRETRRSRTEVKFVKATEQTDEDASGNQTSPDVAVKPMATTKSGLKGLMFVKSSDTTETGNEEGFNKETDKESPTEQQRMLFAGLQMDSKEVVGENMLNPQEDVDSEEDLNCRPSFSISITEEPSVHMNSRTPKEWFEKPPLSTPSTSKGVSFVKAGGNVGKSFDLMNTNSCTPKEWFDKPPPSSSLSSMKGMAFVKASEGAGSDAGNSFNIMDTNSCTPKEWFDKPPSPSPKSSTMSFVKSDKQYQSTTLRDGSAGPQVPAAKSVNNPSASSALNLLQKPGGLEAMQKFSSSHDHKMDQAKELQGKFQALSHALDALRRKSNTRGNVLEQLHIACTKVQPQMTANCIVDMVPPHGFTGRLEIDCVLVAVGNSVSNKRQAKYSTYEKATDLLRCHHLQVDMSVPSRPVLKAGPAPQKLVQPYKGNMPRSGHRGFQHQHQQVPPLMQGRPVRGTKRRQPQQVNNPSEFYILEQEVQTQSQNAASLLKNSADFCKMSLDFDFTDLQTMQVRCQVSVTGRILADACGINRQAAKAASSEQALQHLRERCWTIIIKQAHDTKEDPFSKEEVCGASQSNKASGHIPSSNIGSKLLQKMGWSGGGVGKTGQGIAEPVTVNSVINREGLGLMAEKGIQHSFLPKVREMLQTYTRSSKEYDMTFSPCFTKEERALIHQEAQKLSLKTHSHGTGDDRYLVVSRKRTAQQLFQYIFQQGGETSKYKLIPPTTKEHLQSY